MTAPLSAQWASSRVQCLVCPSQRIQEEMLPEILASWDGIVRRHHEPDDVQHLLINLDTPSLFDPAACEVIRCDDRWLKTRRDAFIPLIGQAAVAGTVLLLVDKLGKKDKAEKAFFQALEQADAVHYAELPSKPWEMESWVAGRLHALPGGVEQAGVVARTLIEARGQSFDGILAAIDQAVDHADGPITPHDVQAAVGGEAERPPWEFTDAVFAGRLRQAIELCYNGKGVPSDVLLHGISAELRLMLASLASDEDKDVRRLAGTNSRKKLGPVRKQAQRLRQRRLERLLDGCIQTWRTTRTGGDNELAMELYLANAMKLLS